MGDPLESHERVSFAKGTPQREVRSYGQQLHINNGSLPLLPTHSRLHEDQIRENIEPIGSGSPEILNDGLCTGHSPPEFIGNGGDKGIFKPPIRASFHPHCPPCLELRPHPLRETQVGKFLRTIASTDTQLWAGQDSGVRVWNFSDAYEAGIGISDGARRGDEQGAPFYESVNTSPAMCLIVDSERKLVWSGHTDGKIRSWKIDQRFDDSPFKESFSWQAHSGPILSMVMTSYGDIWSGSEAGVLKIWLWEAIKKSLSLSAEERHLAALMLEGSAIDLRSQVTVNCVCKISSSDVKCLLSDHVRAKVWAAGSLSFSLWNARTKELLKVYNIDGQIENQFDVSSVQEQAVEDDTNVKFVSKSIKEKSQGCSFYQQSCNAIMGAAGAVRQVATKARLAFLEGLKRTEALVMAVDGMIWSGSSNGLLVQWDGNGNRFQDFQHHPCAVQCLCTYGSRIWVGYMSGLVQVLDLEGNLIAGWVAHSSPVIKLVIGIGYVFSLSINGSIHGWNITSPGPLDDILCSELARKELMYMRQDNVKILVGTWNVNQGRASHDSLMSWIGSGVSDVGIVVVGLQEMEMGVGFLAISAAKETVGLEGSAIGRWWQDMIGRTLDEGLTFERVGSRQLAGLLIAIWVRKNLRAHVGDLDVAAVACGLGQVIGNKGGVGLRLRVYDRILCFVNCHFAAHLEAIDGRNADFDHIYRTMVFSQSSKLLCSLMRHLLLSFSLAFSMYVFWQFYSSGLPLVLSIIAGVSSAIQMLRCTSIQDFIPGEQKPELAEADMTVFLGDFNYRLLGISYDEARDFIKQRNFDWLRERDQLRAEMTAGKVFQGMREGLIRFPPTYKFEKGKEGLEGYDSGKKKRIPAWCDRILYRDNRLNSAMGCSLECPVVSSILQSVRRQEFGKIVKSNDQFTTLFEDLCYVPEILVSTNNIILQNQDTSIIRITNKSGKDEAIFQIICEGQSTIKEDEQASYYHLRGSLGFPCWLEVMPAAGTIKPNQFVEVSVHYEDLPTPEELMDLIPQSWSNDNEDKEVMLLVIVKGGYSSRTTSHQVRLRASSQARRATLIQEVAVPESQVSSNYLAS